MEKQQELCVEIFKRGPMFLESEEWTDCKFVVGAEPHQVVVGGYKLVLAMASPVFEAMFYGTMAETRDPIPIVDVEPEIFKAMIQYIYTSNINITSYIEASQLCYTAKKYMLHHLVDECSNYLWNNVNLENVCQLYEYSELFEDEFLMQKCVNLFTDKTKELLNHSSFKDAALSTITKIFSLDALNIGSEVDLINAAAFYLKATETRSNSPGPYTVPHKNESMMNVDDDLEVAFYNQTLKVGDEQTTPETSDMLSDTAEKQRIRSAIQNIRFLTLTPQQYHDCAARLSLLTESEDHAVSANLVSDNPSVPIPSGFSTSRVPRMMEARTEATIRFTVQQLSQMSEEMLSPEFYVRKLPWQIKVMPKTTHRKYLGFFIQCNKVNESPNWSCFAVTELRLLCHKPGADAYSRKIQHTYNQTENDWGFSHFISWETLLDPAQGYLQDDAITLEVHLTADEPLWMS